MKTEISQRAWPLSEGRPQLGSKAIGKPRPIPLKDRDGFWVGTALEPYGLVYHPKKIQRLGAINLAGQTPIILVNDGPSMGGFINPYTVPSAAFWKLGQSKPGDIYRFKSISVDEAQTLRLALRERCGPSNIV